MWPTGILHQFANGAQNKPSLDARLRVVLDLEHSSGRYCIVSEVGGEPRVSLYVSSALSPQTLYRKNRDLQDANVSAVPTIESDLGAEFVVIFSGKNEVAYLLRELMAQCVSGNREAGTLLANIEATLKTKSKPLPRPALVLIQGGLAGQPVARP